MADYLWKGFRFAATTPIGAGHETGAGILEGPNGSPAGLHWEYSDGPFIERIEAPGADHWGVYRVGFTHPVNAASDFAENLDPLLPKLKILYERLRGTVH